ncbi:MAG: glutamate-1-semialdehyde 2,1-aminomutase [Planctomycetaceae bacterium]
MFDLELTKTPEARAELEQRGRNALPGGVCSSTRWNKAWKRPVYASRAEGARFWDIEGREFLDFSMSHGASLLGHAPACLKPAFDRAWELGLLGSLDSPLHIKLAEELCEMVPCAERARFTSSGSEATLHALRLCRAVSGRDKVIRFFGHFHGYHEFTFIGGHPPADQLDAVPPYRESAGIPKSLAELIVPVEYNDLDALEKVVVQHRDEVGTILIEPVDFNCGCILPEPGFLEAARDLANRYEMILFFDEIQSFAKKSPGGAQQDFGVTPDICTIGKSLGAGLPLSAILGRAELMDRFAPVGDVAHSGTFNAPLINVLAGLTFLAEIRKPEFWKKIESLGTQLYAGLDEITARSSVPVRFQHHGSRFGMVIGTSEPVRNYREALQHDRELMLEFCRETTNRGVYFHDYGGGPCHHGYSLAHTADDIATVLQVIEDSLSALKL